MKKLSSINTEAPPNSWLQVDPAFGVSRMEYLYAKLDAMYPGRWKANFTSAMAIQIWKETWVQAFDGKKLTLKQFNNGIAQCLDMFKWPPSLPEFLEACYTVSPLMHRNMPPPMLTGKETKEGREKGIEMLRNWKKENWGE